MVAAQNEALEWRDVVATAAGAPYWIHRAGYAEWGGTRTVRHTHADFAEIFWVESGRAVHELNGVEHAVRPGDLVFVSSGDIHRYRAASTDFGIVNLAVPHDLVEDLVDRYLPAMKSPWQRPPPRIVRFAVHDWARVLELGNALGHGRQTRLRLDHFLLELLIILEGVPAERAMPDWLAQAIRSWRDDPVAMREGVSGIARRSGRSREHVSRAIKKATGHRAIDLVNSLRIEHAAALLRTSDCSITQIAIDSGLPNLSHFYEVFKHHFGATPRQYRLSQRRATNPWYSQGVARLAT